ncbi:unnamed protein product, partial [Scytosiphon promiscuus]
FSVYTYEGSDDPWVVDSGRQQNNKFYKNTIIGGARNTISLRQADNTKFNKNTFEDVTELYFEESEGTIMRRNTGLDDVELGVRDSCFHPNSDSDFTPVC